MLSVGATVQWAFHKAAMKLRRAGPESASLPASVTTGRASPTPGGKRPATDPLTGLPLRPSFEQGPRPSKVVHPKRALGVLSFPCEVSAAQLRNRAQLAIESNDKRTVSFCWLQARDLEAKEVTLAKGTAASSLALPPLALGLLPMTGTIGRHRKTEHLCWQYLLKHCATNELIAIQAMDLNDKNIASRIASAIPESGSGNLDPAHDN